jgi:ADP-ribose pyrophosphatase YjhB (NUDIX family)
VERDVPLKSLLRWSESLSAIARTGLGFTESQYERERFEEILHVAGEIQSVADHGVADDDDARGLVTDWLAGVGRGVPGYVTPKVAVGAAVANDKGELLLMQRADSGVWLYPTGWCDPGYSAAEVVVKEVAEETGILVEPVRLIGVLDGLRLGTSRIALYSLLLVEPSVASSTPTHWSALTSVGLPPTTCRRPSWVTSAGAITFLPRFAVRSARSTTTRCVLPSGAAPRTKSWN